MKSRSEFSSDKEYADYLRTYVAAMAMQGMTAQADRYSDSEHGDNIAAMVSDAVAMADELLKQLSNS